MLYLKDKECVSVGTSFIYEVFVYLKKDNYCMMINSALYESKIEIKNIIKYYRMSKYIEIITDLKEAPIEWLKDNGYEKIDKK